MPENEVREMLYLLNTANLDCYEYYHPDRSVIQSGPVAFCGWLETKDCRPYRTEVQLYKSLLFLKRSIDRDLIVSAQREALQTLRCIISNLEYRFYKAYGMEIEDARLDLSAECLMSRIIYIIRYKSHLWIIPSCHLSCQSYHALIRKTIVSNTILSKFMNL